MRYWLSSLFLTLAFTNANAAWTDVYTIGATEIQNHRVSSTEKVSDFVNCDYRLKLPKTLQRRGDVYIPAFKTVSAVHFVDEFYFRLDNDLGAHALASSGKFKIAKPANTAVDARDIFNLTLILGRGGLHSRIVNAFVTQIKPSSPAALEMPLSTLPSYEPFLVIQKNCSP